MEKHELDTFIASSTARYKLTKGQSKVLEMAVHGDGNIFITGGAGSGKSTVVRQIIETLRNLGKSVLVCATTGVAAMNLEDGMTIHAAFHFPSLPCIVNDAAKGMYLKVSTSALVKTADAIIVDEISMAPPDLADSVILSIRKAAEKTGRKKRIIFVGDFFQLCPVLPADSSHRALLESYYGAKHENWYAFMGKHWDECNFQVGYLSEIMRQTDEAFIRSLNQVRVGDASCIDYLNTALHNKPSTAAVSLFAYKQKAFEENNFHLDALEGEMFSYTTKYSFSKETEKFMSSQIESVIPKKLYYKQGAQILFTATDYNGASSSQIVSPKEKQKRDGRPNIVNGMMGTIIEAQKESVIVRTENGKMLEIVPMVRPIFAPQLSGRQIVKEKIGEYTQYPFILAYSLTVHRAQGQTLIYVVVDPDTFAPGQLYVALSRATSKEGLRLTRPIRPEDLKVDPAVVRFYERIEKMAGVSKKKGRPVKNTDGTRRSKMIWVPKTISAHVREEIIQNRIMDLPMDLKIVPGRIQMRVTEEMYDAIDRQKEAWRERQKKHT